MYIYFRRRTLMISGGRDEVGLDARGAAAQKVAEQLVELLGAAQLASRRQAPE